MAYDHVKWEEYTLHFNLTREQIQNSPGVDTDKPVSRQWETEFYGYYGWPGYWGGMGVWGGYGYPGMLSLQPYDMSEIMPKEEQNRVQEHTDSHLRSTKEVSGYKISAADGYLGHIDDFIVDEESWTIRYLAVYAGNWWAGKKVLLPPDWIDQISWPDRTVTVDVTREQIKNAPEWDSSRRIDRALEERLNQYFLSQVPGIKSRTNSGG
jgi:hypothetical protein